MKRIKRTSNRPNKKVLLLAIILALISINKFRQKYNLGDLLSTIFNGVEMEKLDYKNEFKIDNFEDEKYWPKRGSWETQGAAERTKVKNSGSWGLLVRDAFEASLKIKEIDLTQFSKLSFFIKGYPGDKIDVFFADSYNKKSGKLSFSLNGEWEQVNFKMEDFAKNYQDVDFNHRKIKRLVFEKKSYHYFYLDDIYLDNFLLDDAEDIKVWLNENRWKSASYVSRSNDCYSGKYALLAENTSWLKYRLGQTGIDNFFEICFFAKSKRSSQASVSFSDIFGKETATLKINLYNEWRENCLEIRDFVKTDSPSNADMGKIAYLNFTGLENSGFFLIDNLFFRNKSEVSLKNGEYRLFKIEPLRDWGGTGELSMENQALEFSGRGIFDNSPVVSNKVESFLFKKINYDFKRVKRIIITARADYRDAVFFSFSNSQGERSNKEPLPLETQWKNFDISLDKIFDNKSDFSQFKFDQIEFSGISPFNTIYLKEFLLEIKPEPTLAVTNSIL